MYTISRECLRAFLVITCCIVLCCSKKYSAKRKRTKANKHVVGSTRGLEELPDFVTLLSNAEKVDGGMKYNYEGCEIVVIGKGEEFNLDLTNDNCKNFVSLKNIFTKLMSKPPDAGTDRFTTLDKFNIDKVSLNKNTKYVSLEASSKEPFQLVNGLEVSGKMVMKFTFKGTSTTFESIGMEIDGDVKVGSTNMKYNLIKTENSKEGAFSIIGDHIKISDFYAAFTKKTELDDDKLADKQFLETVVNNPTIKGSRDEAGNTEIVLTATADNIPGLTKGSFAVVIAAPYQQKPDGGVIVELTGITPATILSKLIPKVKFDEIPIFKDFQITVVIEYASADMQPKDSDLHSLLQGVTTAGQVNKGMKLKFKMPFKEVLAKNSLDAPPNTNLDQYVTVNFVDGKISVDFPPDAAMDIINIAIALIPGITKPVLEKIFKNPPLVTFHKFEVDVKTSAVDIELEASGKVGFKFFSVDWMKFTIKHESGKDWDFSLSATKSMGSGTLELAMAKKGNEYEIEGGISRLSTADITDNFSVDSKIKTFMKGMKSLNMAISEVKIKLMFGNKLNIQFSGKVTFLQIQAVFEGYVVEVTPDSTAVLIGIVIHNEGISDIAKEFFKTENNPDVKILDQKWMSRVTTSFIFGNKAAVQEVTFENDVLQAATKPSDIGISFCADVEIPEDCKEEVLCEFVKKRIGAGQHLSLSGVIDKTKLSLDAAFSGSIPIGTEGKYTIEKAGFAISAGVKEAPTFSIYGEMKVDIKEQNTIIFKAKLGLSATLTITLELTMENMLKEAFGFKYLELGNLNMEAAINVLTGLPAFSLAGTFRLGVTAKAIEVNVAGGFNAMSGQFHMYANINRLTLRAALEAFESKPDTIKKIPEKILDTGFPDGVVAGFSFPGETELPTFGVTLQTGFYLKGKINLFGLGVECEILVNWPGITVKAKMDKISTAGTMVQLTHAKDRNQGPEFNLVLGETEVVIQISAYAEVLGIGVGTLIDINKDEFNFEVTGNFLNLFRLEVKLTAPFREKITSLGAKEWKISACLNTDTNGAEIQNVMSEGDKEVQEVASELEESESNTEELQKSGGWYKKAQDKVDEAKENLEAYEKEYEDMVKKVEEKKKEKKYDQNCIAVCEEDKVSVGGIIEVNCPGVESIKCPKFVPEKYKAVSPQCIAGCSSDFTAEIKGWFKGKQFATTEAWIKFYSKLVEKMQVYLVRSRKLFDAAEAGKNKLKAFWKEGKEFVKKAKDWIKKNVIDIKHICINSALREDLCFSISAEFTIFKKEVSLKDEEGCFSTKWAKNLGKTILKKAFPDLDEWRQKAKEIKDLLLSSSKDAEEVKTDADDVDSFESRKRTIDDDIDEDDSRFADILGTPPDYVVRNDACMQAFRDLFFINKDDEASSAHVGGNEASTAAKTITPIEIDASALSAEDTDPCRRTKAVLNLYNGVSDSLSALLENNLAAKEGYGNFTDSFLKSFDPVEKTIRAKARSMNMSDYDTSEMLFYVTYGREGVANMKRQLDIKFDTLDKASLKGWKAYMSKKADEKNLDVQSFMNLVSQASASVAKKWQIPETDMNYAEETMKSIMTGDDEGLSANEPSIRNLATAVENLQRFTKCK